MSDPQPNETKKNIAILHGWAADGTRFRLLQEFFESEGWNVWVPDLPGFGLNQPPDFPWAVDDYVDWCQEEVRKLGWSDYSVLGHSFGGRIAIKLSLRRPIGLNKLILVSAAGIRPSQGIWRMAVNFGVEVGKRFFSLPVLRSLREHMRWFLYKLIKQQDYYKTAGVMKESFVKIVEEDLQPVLDQVSNPTLIIWGDRDTLTPVKDAYLMHELIPESELEVIPDQGHLFIYQPSHKVFERIKNFLQQ